MTKYNEGDIILCTVTDIAKTTVFVETEDGTKGSIVFSEVAPGRIRNIRQYAVPKKIIACKVLHIRDDHLFLSLRRVKEIEKRELMEEHKKEKTWKTVLKKIIGEEAEKIIEKIKEAEPVNAFFEQAREKSELLGKYFDKSQIEKLEKVVKEKKEKEKEVKKEFKLSSKEPDGILKIKEIISPYENITYLGSSKFQIKIKSIDLKKAGSELNKIIETIEKQAKKAKCNFEKKK